MIFVANNCYIDFASCTFQFPSADLMKLSDLCFCVEEKDEKYRNCNSPLPLKSALHELPNSSGLSAQRVRAENCSLKTEEGKFSDRMHNSRPLRFRNPDICSDTFGLGLGLNFKSFDGRTDVVGSCPSPPLPDTNIYILKLSIWDHQVPNILSMSYDNGSESFPFNRAQLNFRRFIVLQSRGPFSIKIFLPYKLHNFAARAFRTINLLFRH